MYVAPKSLMLAIPHSILAAIPSALRTLFEKTEQPNPNTLSLAILTATSSLSTRCAGQAGKIKPMPLDTMSDLYAKGALNAVIH